MYEVTQGQIIVGIISIGMFLIAGIATWIYSGRYFDKYPEELNVPDDKLKTTNADQDGDIPRDIKKYLKLTNRCKTVLNNYP